MVGSPIKKSSQLLEKVVTPSSLIIIDGDVVKTYTHADIEFSDESADQNVEAIWELIKGKRFYHLQVTNPSTYVTLDARDYRNLRFESVKRAEAIVIKTLGHRILAEFYRKARGVDYPIRLFDSEEKALEWFDSLREREDMA